MTATWAPCSRTTGTESIDLAILTHPDPLRRERRGDAIVSVVQDAPKHPPDTWSTPMARVAAVGKRVASVLDLLPLARDDRERLPRVAATFMKTMPAAGRTMSVTAAPGNRARTPLVGLAVVHPRPLRARRHTQRVAMTIDILEPARVVDRELSSARCAFHGLVLKQTQRALAGAKSPRDTADYANILRARRIIPVNNLANVASACW